MPEETSNVERLALMRKPFEEHQICKLPKPTRVQTDKVKKNFKEGIRCKLCGGWHHKDVVHLDYVGHAALTDRLLEVDPLWNWEPLASDEKGAPVVDSDGGMWIFLTVCGLTRRGYGDAGGKTGSNATKERIGDALRNAAMRFGAALDLWHKGELHGDDVQGSEQGKTKPVTAGRFENWLDAMVESGKTIEEVETAYSGKASELDVLSDIERKKVDGYKKDLIEMMKENAKPTPPKTFKCSSGLEVTATDCMSCPKESSCEELKAHMESK